GMPDAAFVAAPSLLVFDHLTRRVALLHAGPAAERLSLRREVIRLLRGRLPANGGPHAFSRPAAAMSEQSFRERVATAQEHIAAGDIYHIVLSVLFSGRTGAPPFEIYRALRLLNPSPYMFWLSLGDLKVAGSSPEALVRLHGRRAALRP